MKKVSNFGTGSVAGGGAISRVRSALLVLLSTALLFGASAPLAFASDGVLGVTQISAVQTFATADGTFANGWKWTFDVTVPTNETVLNMRFADWTNGSNSIPAGSNIQFYSAQSSNASDEAHAISINAAGVYSGAMNLNSGDDLDVSKAGRQVEITVEARVPVGSTGGSYSTSYGVNSTDPDVATVATAKSAISSATYTGLQVTSTANQTQKTAALQTAVNTAKNDATVTATVTFVTPNYSVAISKGVASDTYIVTTATFSQSVADAATLASAKTAAVSDLAAYKNSADYRDAEKATLASAITDGDTAINGAANTDAVSAALASAKGVIDAIKTDAQLTAEETATSAVATAKSAIGGATYSNLQVLDTGNQSQKTAAVQAVVDSVKDTTTAVVTFDTDHYHVAISKGAASDTTNVTATFSQSDADAAAEATLVQAYTDANSAGAFVTLLNANALSLTLGDYSILDSTGKTDVGTALFTAEGTLTTKGLIQTAVTDAITTVKTASDARIADIAQVALAKAAVLAMSPWTATEGVDSNAITKVQAVVDLASTGVVVTLKTTDNTQVAVDGGAITYGTGQVTGDVTFTLTKNVATDDQLISVVVPAANQ